MGMTGPGSIAAEGNQHSVSLNLEKSERKFSEIETVKMILLLHSNLLITTVPLRLLRRAVQN